MSKLTNKTYPAVERQRRQDSCLDAPLVQRGERPGDRRVEQRHPRVDGREGRRGRGLRAGEHLRVGRDLRVHLQPHDAAVTPLLCALDHPDAAAEVGTIDHLGLNAPPAKRNALRHRDPRKPQMQWNRHVILMIWSNWFNYTFRFIIFITDLAFWHLRKPKLVLA